MNNYEIAEKIVNRLYPDSFSVREHQFPVVRDILDYELSVADEQYMSEFSAEDLNGN